jgi:glyoxylase-like metal-dependent hydrolase (beta-lactamase superfamily II)
MTTPSPLVTIDSDVTPQFTACYLRLVPDEDECAFLEAHTAHALPRLLGALAAAGRRPESVRWVIVTHAHLDHAAGASALLEACPNATLLAHPRAAKNLIDPSRLIAGAQAVYGEARFAELYGTIRPIPAARVRSLGDGERFDLGNDQLTAHHTAGHAFHHFIVDDPATDTVFTGDTFGLVYPALQGRAPGDPHARFAFPSTSPTGFHAEEARRSIVKVLDLGRRFVAPTHFGRWAEKEVIGQQVRRFIDQAEEWLREYDDFEGTTEALEADLRAAIWLSFHEAAPWLDDADRQLLGLDVELNAQGLAHAILGRRDTHDAGHAS